ncbi:m-phase inducer phosphatase [Elasticomyces elasticus]|uniref:M-phase inducer phosphatase n=1 Tax=Exophiala sideris TaxID=1016849 RepID=A0ABR0JRA7_9EURO|nr:m-phase inducer phosphatase [Elasticomyces elasticus]KAK5034559.1 m-phase inducer phosphatase [Exophiala sideris]KAK5040119.1 m-phase inducer phosphatase [Exophiala sideris]KAK5068497.1 m-phase inducer phosphatase [Exophiala sideris]KAK5187800.1 m-phase inducer phosphatase [Eurotiomycetes sp. CCFEE 6388]
MNMIEASSPLAAMQHPAFMGHCGFRPDGPTSYASFAVGNNFNFKDLSMKKPRTDYFSLKPVRGSSPTASLAADLSQNFHIDQSPQLPTPRRALFPNNMFASQQNGHVTLTTPPIPSSSPGTQESMDIDVSPLPHKAPFCAVEIQLQSPTPESTPLESPALSVPSPQPTIPQFETMQLNVPSERRRSGPLRPSLVRTKGYSTGTLPQRPAPESQAPQFKFMDYCCNKPANSSSLALSEIFAESPVQEKPAPVLAASPAFVAPRPRFGLCTGNSRNGSPMAGHARKGSNPGPRPRKQFRRSLSMFEHPEDVMKREKERMSPPPPLLPSIMDVEAPHVPQLPHFTQSEVGALPRITKETMIEVLDGKYNSCYEKLVVIDCRFEYEFNGGHIDGAVNFNDKEQLSSQLFDIEPTAKALLIFHCEYSAHRAPLMAKFIRNRDRTVNAERYPALTYPEVYILDGGYSTFFKDYRSRCFPQNYVEMDAKEHVLDCERGLGKVKQRSKLVRAQTFAFGQHSPVDSSPTAMGRSLLDGDMDIDMGLEYTPVAGPRPGLNTLRGANIRNLSY